jgi:hypothetical protein
MAAIFQWCEDNGTQTAAGSTLRGATRTGHQPNANVPHVNWKNHDSVTGIYSEWPITAGNNSYTKYQFGLWTGTFNSISNVLYQHVSGTFGAGLTLKFTGISGYVTPATTSYPGHDLTLTGSISTGISIFLASGGPEVASVITTINSSGYSSYLVTQLQTTAAASAGDTATCTVAIRFDET